MASENLEKVRIAIDEVDQKMAELFASRLDLVSKVHEIKKNENLPILDTNREQMVININLAYIHNPEYIELYKEFINKVMELSRTLQEEKK